LVLDFQKIGSIQPSTKGFSQSNTASTYGTAVYGTGTYGNKPQYYNRVLLTGNFFNMSLQFIFDQEADDPFTLDTIVLEYKTKDRN
jgi:hypothetical protein